MNAFKHAVALDIKPHIDDFVERMKALGCQRITVLERAEELLMLDDTVDALLVSIYQTVTVDHIKQFSNLRYVGVLGTSVAKIPYAYCLERGIVVKNIKEYCDYDTAEWVIGQIIRHFRDQRPQRSVFEKSLGLIGVGAVGRQVLKVAAALGMRIFYDATKNHVDCEQLGARRLSKEEIFASCDVVSLHTPPHMQWLKESHLAHAKFGQVIINSCFGKISYDHDLENFLDVRRDITLCMDHIAAMSYLGVRAVVDSESAYDTIDAHQRLERWFFDHIVEAMGA